MTRRVNNSTPEPLTTAIDLTPKSSYNLGVTTRRWINALDHYSFFLLGPRGTGKSTFLRQQFKDQDTFWVDLLKPELEHAYSLHPSLLAEQILASPPASGWVVLDEVQKVPALLDVVHDLLENSPIKDRLYFAMTGSSARKLKAGAANLLAGRAFVYQMAPLTSFELGPDFQLHRALEFGTLPKLLSFNSGSTEVQTAMKKEFLYAYAFTYLKEEVQLEGWVRDLDAFRKFLPVAAQANGQLVNFSKISRDVGVDDKTVRHFFSILEDTWIGFFIEPYSRSTRKRQGRTPRFYFFDTGVKRALDRSLEIPLQSQTFAYGRAFEHFIVTECVRLNEILRRKYEFSMMTTKDGAEIDLIIERPGQSTLCIEIKSAVSVDVQDLTAFRALCKDIPNSECLVWSQEPKTRVIEELKILPWQQGLREAFGVEV